MSDSMPADTTIAEEVPDKGKGKAVEQPVETEEESSDDEEMAGDDSHMELEEEADDDDLAEIDPANIIPSGRRTRGKQVDFQAAQADQMDDDEDDDDDDFQAPKEDDDDAMDTK